MGTQYSWAEIREQAAEAFGGYPDAALEQELLDVFRERPAFVVDAIADVRKAYEAGRIHSPWPFLRKKLTAPAMELVVTDERERDKKVGLAEQWLRTSCLHFDRESEVADELFGDTGRLRVWASDEAMRARLLALWRQVRPRGEQVELEALERAAMRRAVREKLAAKRAAKLEAGDVEEWAGEEQVASDA